MLLLLIACQGTRLSERERELIENHIVTFDALGKPMNPETNIQGWEIGDQEMTPHHYEERVRLMMEHARKYLTERPNRKVLVFIHGGLNTYGDTRDRILARAARMKQEGYYPIFISWDSGLFGSYSDNLFCEEGEWSLFKVCMSPFAFVRDIVVGILNIPPRATRAVGDLLQRGEGHGERTAASVALRHDAMRKPDVDDPDSEKSPAQRAAWEDRNRGNVDLDGLALFEPAGFGGYYRYSPVSLHLLTLPVSITTSLFFDAFGKGAWEEMVRRTKFLFDDVELSNVGSARRHAGLSLLMQELAKLQASLNRAPPQVRRDARSEITAGGSLWPVGDDFAAKELRSDESQRGLVILRLGFRRLLDKINDPRYAAEIDGILVSISQVPKADWAQLWDSVTGITAQADMIGSDGLVLVFETIVRLMFPGEAAGLNELVDALADAWRDSEEVRALLGEHREFRQIIERLLGKGVNRQALDLVVRALLDYVEMRLAAVQRTEAEVVIFAHSMGAIIVNEILRRSDWFPTPRFKDIVYMGAACSIRDYEDSVFPYLKRNKYYLTQFHNLMLHPRAEDEEVSFYDVTPRGSLLVYIDHYLTIPSTPHDRTLGQFTNVMLSLDRTQPEVAGQIHMKVFPIGGKGEGLQQPEGHGEFVPARFWEPSFFRTKRQLRQIREAAEKLKNRPAGRSA